jgi:hypothetical protein
MSGVSGELLGDGGVAAFGVGFGLAGERKEDEEEHRG